MKKRFALISAFPSNKPQKDVSAKTDYNLRRVKFKEKCPNFGKKCPH